MLSLLIMEICEKDIRAAVIRRKLRGYRVLEHVIMPRQEQYGPLGREELAAVKTQLSHCPKDMVVISSQVSLIEINLDQAKYKKIKKGQMKEVVKWEIEPYITTAPLSNLVGYLVLPQRKAEKKEAAPVTVWVTLIPEDEYTLLRETAESVGLRLVNVYPAEVCFPLLVLGKKRQESQAILYLDEHNLKAAWVRDGYLSRFRSLPLGTKDIAFHIENQTDVSIREQFQELLESEDGERMVLLGPGSKDVQAAAFLRDYGSSHLDIAAAIDSVQKDSQSLSQVELVNLEGAAVAEWGLLKGYRSAGINDRIPLNRLLREKIHFVPVLAFTIFLCFFLGHYGLMKYQIYHAQASITRLEGEKNRILGAQKEYAALKTSETELKTKLELAETKTLHLNGLFDDRADYLLDILIALSTHRSANLEITSITSEQIEREYMIKGLGREISPINSMLKGLQTQPWCEFARLEEIKEDKGSWTFVIHLLKIAG